MRIRATRLHAFHLPLRASWASAADRFSVRTGWLLRIETDDGPTGFGDCAPLRSAGTETPDQALKSLVDWCQTAAGQEAREALVGLGMLATPAARCAIESALLDLIAQFEGLPLGSLLGGEVFAPAVRVNAAIGSLDRAIRARAEAALQAGFTVLKIKVGVEPLHSELGLIRELAGSLPPHVWLRLDANQAWEESAAAQFIDACADLPVDAIEEPLAGADRSGLRRLQARCSFPLAVDESWSANEAECFFADPPVRRLILKPPRLGGLKAALNLGRYAVAAGVECVVTSSVDSACGIFAAAHVAAALDNRLAHGLATSSWLAADVGVPPAIIGGEMTLPGTPGLGFVPDGRIDFIEPDALRTHAAAALQQ
ncbi:MAG: enolase C-terminal domain-like protein [Rhodocyclaceae bacterium]